MNERIVAHRDIDITREICPMTFVRTRLALDALAPGEILGVLLRGEEPLRNVPATARHLGHTVLGEEAQLDSSVRILIQKAVLF